MKNLKNVRLKLIVSDPSLKSLFKRHRDIVFTPQLKREPYESLVRAIAHQQLHTKAAETILGRFLDLYGKKQFPAPKEIAKTPLKKLRACGFSQSKCKSIFDIAQHAIDKKIPTSLQIKKLSNEHIIEQLTEIYGVGRWTVEMLLIFQLGRLDVWPRDDFGIRKGYQIFKKLKTLPTAKELIDTDKKWAPYQSVVALYLWREADLIKASKKSSKSD